MPPPTSDNRPAFTPRLAGDFKDLFERLPPHAPEAEMALLGSLILSPEALDDVIGLVPSSNFFYAEAHGAIFDAIKELYDTHRAGDLVLLTQHLRDSEILQQVGGLDYLVQLAGQTPSAANAVYYAKLVRAKALLRFLIDACGQTVYDAMNAGTPAFEAAVEVLDRAESRVFEIAGQVADIPGETLEQLLNELMDALEANEGRAITGVATNYSDLDEMTSGLQRGELLILAARPSMGKTAMALNLAEQIAFGGSPYAAHGPATPVGFFSMEMSRQAIAQRLLCARAGVDSHRFRTNRLRKEDFSSLMSAADALSKAKLYVDDTPSLSVMMLRAKARRMVKKYGVQCLFIDYLQLMTAPGASNDGRQQEVSAISRGVKALARELNIPIVCLAQLNRGAEQREGHRPRMADLRESGSIEQDADVIMLLHREEYYHVGDQEWADENPDKIGLSELIIAKQRNGPTGTVKLSWDNATTRFKNHAAPIGSFGSDRREAPSHTQRRDPASPGTYRIGSGSGSASGAGGPASGLAPRTRPAGPGAGPSSSPEPRPVGFAPGNKSGPVADFRDGGGPDADAPFDSDDDGSVNGLPV
jgi:replicative DNA helicase